MSSCFAFRFFEPGEHYRKSLAIFTETRVEFDALVRALKHDVTDNLVPKNVYLVTAAPTGYTQQDCKADTGFVSEFDVYVGDIDGGLKCLTGNSSGVLTYCDGKAAGQDLSASILQSGMLALFRKHRGLIISNTAYHFVKPSGAHCDKFIRASNLLVSSGEVAFLAISLLPCLKPGLKRIYVDTSSIAFLISIAVRMYGEFEEGDPEIESFESYAALDQSYDFVEDETSMVFISATTSGSLAAKLLDETNLANGQIFTIFHINLPVGQNGIFDVSSAIEGGLVSTKPSQCGFCERGSKPIRIAGEQFLPENPKHELLVVRKRDFSTEREHFFRQFAASHVLLWNKPGVPYESAKEHFYIDVKEAIESRGVVLGERLEKAARRYISQDLKTVIMLDDVGSQVLGEAIKPYIREPEGLEFTLASNMDESRLEDSRSVMVVAGAITSGRKLLAIARKLRCINPLSTIVYFVGFSKLPNNEARQQLEKDLCQGGHELVVLNTCPTPRIKEYAKTAWDWEREKLAPFGEDDPLGNTDESLPALLEGRRQRVIADDLEATELFLPDSQGNPLILRRTFAFWSNLGFDNERLENTTQSDVYWTIQCVLHDLRNKSENDGLATVYHTTLISPANFDRYNDGVIQACLLRAAHPVELDYRVDPVFSRQMTDVFVSVMRNWNNGQGEAALEFLIALWSGRLQLLDEHLAEVADCRVDEMSDDLKFILGRLQSSPGNQS